MFRASINLESGDSELIVQDAGAGVFSLGMTENIVLVIGDGGIAEWNFPAGNCRFDSERTLLTFRPQLPINQDHLPSTTLSHH